MMMDSLHGEAIGWCQQRTLCSLEGEKPMPSC